MPNKDTSVSSEINFVMLNALCLMYDQYCSGTMGHDFMGAGEAAIDVLESYGLTKDEFHIADDWESRLQSLKPSNERQSNGN